MTRNIDVYDGHPDKALEAFTKDPSVKGVTTTPHEKELLRRFLNWATLPALYQEEEPQTNDDIIAESLRSIADSLHAIAVIKGAPVRWG